MRLICVLSWFLVIPAAAYAYIGPGMGAGAVAAILGIIGSIILVAVTIIYYPIKRAIKKRKARSLEKG